jgi:hypothetical protein
MTNPIADIRHGWRLALISFFKSAIPGFNNSEVIDVNYPRHKAWGL